MPQQGADSTSDKDKASYKDKVSDKDKAIETAIEESISDFNPSQFASMLEETISKMDKQLEWVIVMWLSHDPACMYVLYIISYMYVPLFDEITEALSAQCFEIGS